MGLGFSPLRRRRPVADRQHRPGRLRRARYADRRRSPRPPGSTPICSARWSDGSFPFFSVIVPFWLIWAFAGWRGMKEVWPAILVCGVSFAVPQFLDLELHQSVDRRHRRVVISMVCLIGFLHVWQPRGSGPRRAARDATISPRRCPPPPAPRAEGEHAEVARVDCRGSSSASIAPDLGHGWFKRMSIRSSPGTSTSKASHKLVQKVPPVVALPSPEPAVFTFTFLLLQRHRNSGHRDHLGLPDGLLA